MGVRYLADTNACIDYLNNKLPDKASALLDANELSISVITRMELLAWSNATPEQITILEEFVRNINVLDLDESVILKAIEIRKNYRIKLPDAIIAATAFIHGYILVTRNVSDFRKFKDLELLNPWSG